MLECFILNLKATVACSFESFAKNALNIVSHMSSTNEVSRLAMQCPTFRVCFSVTASSVAGDPTVSCCDGKYAF